MSISGIRSYSNQKIEYIEFIKPITIILGENGSGKTTIIECLKLMTSGELPANSQQGKNFIEDPSLSKREEVRANIKVMLRAVNQKQIVASKQLMVSKVKGKYVFKTIESVLQTKNPSGEVMSVNHTCVEMDTQVSDLLGISKVVLDKVTFCHQEDSLWMFSDTTLLSPIFEQLFDTKEFASKLEVIKTLYKQSDKDIRYNSQFIQQRKLQGANLHRELLILLNEAHKYQQQFNALNYSLN